MNNQSACADNPQLRRKCSAMTDMIPKDVSKSSYNLTGAKPQQSKGTIIRIPVGLTVGSKSTSGPPYDWNCQTTETGERSVTVTITPPSDSIVGKYTLFVETQSSGGEGEEQSKDRREEPDEIYILFNPWCPGDCRPHVTSTTCTLSIGNILDVVSQIIFLIKRTKIRVAKDNML